MRKSRDRKGRSRAGFTLIELMVVLVILGLLAGLVMPRLFGQGESARRTAAQVQLSALADAVRQFEVDNGFVPTTEQGLEALVSEPTTGPSPRKYRPGGYLEKGSVPKDPWGNPYVYLYPGNHDDFDIMSYGADGEPGGEDQYADIGHWEAGQ